MAFSASRRSAPPERAVQLCRVLLRVRLVVSILAVLLLLAESRKPDGNFWGAFVFAVLTSLLAYIFWRQIIGALSKHPILLSIDTLISLFVLTAGSRAAPFVIFTVVTSAIAGLLYRWGGMLYITVLQMLCLVTAVAVEVGTQNLDSSISLLAPIVYYPLVGFAGMWIRRLLVDAQAADEARRRAEVVAAAESERGRLARDMHDSLAKTVRGIAFSAAALPTWIRRDQERATQEAAQIAAAAEVASREARDLLSELRSDRFDRPLVEAVRDTCTSWGERTGTEVRLDVDESVELDLGARYEVINVLKEALTNIERHAEAQHVTVRLDGDAKMARLTIEDDGRGFDADQRDSLVAAGHYGLLGMSERVTRVGGDISVESRPGEGTSITLTTPRHEIDPTRVSPDDTAQQPDHFTVEAR